MRTAAMTLLALVGLALLPVSALAQTFERAPREVLEAELMQPRYIFEVEQVFVDDESGPDWLGSDEVFFYFEIAGEPRITAQTGIIGNMDTGSSRDLRLRQRCIAPIDLASEDLNGWDCNPWGVSGPLTFTIEVYEHGANAGGIMAGFCASPAAGAPAGGDTHVPLMPPDDRDRDCYRRGDGQLIAARTVTYTAEELIAVMDDVGDVYSEFVEAHNCFAGHCAFAAGLWTRYRFYVTIHRVN